MHIYVSRALKTALVTGGLFAAGATAAHAEVGGTGLDLNAEASVEVVTEATSTEDVLVDVDATLGGADAITYTGTGEVVTADAEVDLTDDAANEVVDVDAELLGGDLSEEQAADLSEEQAADAADPATVDADVAIGGTDSGDSGTGTGDAAVGTDELAIADVEVDLTGDASNEVVDVDAELLGADLSEEQAADAADPATVDVDLAIGGTDSGAVIDDAAVGTDEPAIADVEIDLTGDASNEVVDVDAELLGGDLSEEQAADAADPATADVDVAIGGTDTGDYGTGTGDAAVGTDELAIADVEVDLTGDASNEVVDVDAELLGGDLSEEQAADAADPATVDVDLALGGTDTDPGTGTGNGGTDTGTDTGTVEVIVDAEVDLGVDSADKTAGDDALVSTGDDALVSTGGGALGTGVLGAGRIVTVANLTHALTASGIPAPQMSGTGVVATSTGSGSLPATGADGWMLGGLAVLLMVAGLALTRRFGVQIS